MNKFNLAFISSFLLFLSSAYADIDRVSVSSTGEQANETMFTSGIGATINADGRYVAFVSGASTLVENDTNLFSDVFVHDRNTGITERISVSPSGEEANHHSLIIPSISADGRFIAFNSLASNLIENDTSLETDTFVHDRVTGITELVSRSSNGVQAGSGVTGITAISANGRFVAFSSAANFFADNDINRNLDVFVHDRLTGETEPVSVNSAGELGNGASQSPFLSDDGRFVSFWSSSTNLVDNDFNNAADIFIHDRQTGRTELVNKSSNGTFSEVGIPINDRIRGGSISADGRIVAFNSRDDNLVEGDTNARSDVFVHDRITGITERISVSTSGIQGNRSSIHQSISRDARYVVFESYATNLLGFGFDNNDRPDIFVHDRMSGITERVSVNAAGIESDGFSSSATISPDGQFIVFTSSATNLVEGDTNDVDDIFVVNNPLVNSANEFITVEKLINNEARETLGDAAKLATGSLYRQSYKVTNDSPNRIYQVRVFENGRMVCNFFSLNAGQTRQRCDTFKTVINGEQHVQVNVSAIVSGSGETLTSSTDAYYTGLNVNGELRVTHRINNVNADSQDQAQQLGSSQTSVSYKVENTGEIELYQVKTYHDPASPINSGWDLQCVLGPLKPGQVRYCKRDITVTESGLNQAMGRVQGRNAIRSASDVVNASNSTYFIAP